MKTKQRFLSVLLALCLCIGLLPMSALAADEVPAEPNTADTNGVQCDGGTGCTHQAAIGDVHYNLLTDAYAALPRNNPSTPTTIHLLRSCSGGSMGSDGTDVGMNYVIDFGGYTYTVGKEMVGSTGYKNQGIRVLKGSTAVFKNGTLKADNDAGFMQVMHTYGNVTLEDFTLDATPATNAMAYEADNGTLDILGNSSILASSGNIGLYVAFWPRGGYPDGTTVTVDTTGTITGALTYEWDDKDKTSEQQTENKAVLNIKNGNFDFSEIETLFTGSLPENLKVPKINITGGTFAADVSDYVATGYECKKLADNQFVVQERVGSLVVNPETAADGSVSATLEGTFVPDAQIEDNVNNSGDDSQTGVSGYEITVDLSTGGSETETGSTTLNVTTATANSLSDASSLTLQTNAGTVVLDARALDKIASASDDVVITVTNTSPSASSSGSDSNVKASYAVSVTSGDKNLLPYGAANNGMVTITVDKPESVSDLQAWYVTGDTGSEVYVEKLNHTVKDDEVEIEITHLSGIVLRDGDPTNIAKVTVTKNDGTTTSYTDFAGAIAATASGSTIRLLDDVESSAAVVIPAGVTLDGNRHTLKYTGTKSNDTPNTGAFITVSENGDDVTIQNLTIDAGENIKHGVQFYCVDGGKLEGVTINGAAWTSVIVNGSTNIVLKDTVLNPKDTAYANIEYAMGSGVTTEPSMTLDNVSFGSSKPAVWADKDTVDKMNGDGGDALTDQAVADKIKESITVDNCGSFTLSVQGTEEGNPVIETVVPSTKPSSGGGGGGGVSNATLTFETNGGSTIAKVTKAIGTTVDLTDYEPTREGYTFDGWYSDKELTKKVTSVKLSSSMTVYAKWTQNEESADLPFTDVADTAWYADEVAYVYENGLMQGTSKTTFAPNLTTTRGMIVTILYRLENEPSVSGACPFDDVQADSWYEDAVTWAAANKIVDGYGDAKFGPEDNITREQMAAILYRYAQFKGYDVTASAELGSFTDAAQVSNWAKTAMQWACGEELIQGDAGKLMPTGNATRAQVAAILMRYCENVAK